MAFKAELTLPTGEKAKLDLGALRNFQNATGKNVMSLINSFEQEMNIPLLAEFFFYALQRCNPDATQDEADDLTATNFEAVMGLLVSFMGDDQSQDEPKAKASRGKK